MVVDACTHKTIPAMISVRSSSTRLRRKCFLKIGSDCSMIEHVIERCKQANLDPIIATTQENDDDDIVSCVGSTARIFRGDVEDKLARWLGACDFFGIHDSFVTVDCDDPFFDQVLTRETFRQLVENRLDIVCPNMDAYLGSHGYAMTYDTLQRIVKYKKSNRTEMIWKFFDNVPTPLRAKVIVAAVLPIEKKIRLTLDYEEDYWLIRTVAREIGTKCDRANIIEFFETNPGLTSVNFFRIKEWKIRQDNDKNV